MSASFLLYTACGTFFYAVCAGFRDNYGIMLPYIVGWSGISYASVSFIIALGQLFFGLMQPVFGLLTLRFPVRYILMLGSSLMLTGLLLIPFSNSLFMLTLSLGLLLPSGTAAASFGIIMACIAPRMTEQQAHMASGIMAAGIGISICVLSPLMQTIIVACGLSGAVLALAVPVLLLIPVGILLTRYQIKPLPGTACPQNTAILVFKDALQHPSYRKLLFAFFTCGFHMALIQTHLFSQLTGFGMSEKAASHALSIYGLGVIAGSVCSGMACARYAMSCILGGLYTSRCLCVLLLLAPLPLSALFSVIFLLGLTGVATVAPTAGLVNRLFGPVRLGALFGLAYLLHQAGAFCSAWAGGLCLELGGTYNEIWYADILLCLLAGSACFHIRDSETA